MTATETTKATTTRQALKAIRLAVAGKSYLSGPLYYECESGTLMVHNAKSKGGCLLGVFEAELIVKGETIRKYKV